MHEHHGPAVVLDVIAGTPVAAAGIRTGDLIVGINGSDLEGKASMDLLQSGLIGPCRVP